MTYLLEYLIRCDGKNQKPAKKIFRIEISNRGLEADDLQAVLCQSGSSIMRYIGYGHSWLWLRPACKWPSQLAFSNLIRDAVSKM